MDYSLVQEFALLNASSLSQVLILVVMDYSLVLGFIKDANGDITCLNPCCNGL